MEGEYFFFFSFLRGEKKQHEISLVRKGSQRDVTGGVWLKCQGKCYHVTKLAILGKEI